MTKPNTAELDELLNYLKIDASGYILWLGAGASVTSGVPLASDIVLDRLWQDFETRRRASDDAPIEPPKDIRKWARATHGWFAPEDSNRSEYSLVMENLLKPKDIREIYLGKLLAKAKASEGYRILGRLIKERIFPTIITTNFDNLVQQGADSAHIVEITERFEDMHSSSDFVRLIRLHGGFHHDLRNTSYELENTPASCFGAIRRMLRSHGLIVVGYSGQDPTVMESLFLSLNPEKELRKGVFWCHRHRDSLSCNVKKFISMHQPGQATLVEIDGFDQMMRRIGAQFGISGSLESEVEAHLTRAWEDQALLLDLIKSICRDRTGKQSRSINEEMLGRLNWFCRGDRAILAICDNFDRCQIVASVGFDHNPPSRIEISENGGLGQCLRRRDDHFQSLGDSEGGLNAVFGDVCYLEGFVVWRGESPRTIVVFGADHPFPERSQLQPIKAGVELLTSLSS